MRNSRQFSLVLALAAGGAVAACSGGKNTAQADDFNNDLKLASSTTMDLATPKADPNLLNASLENSPKGMPVPLKTLKRAEGTHVALAKHPTLHAAPTNDVASSEDVTKEVVTVDKAPAPANSEPVAVAPRPAPVGNPGGGDGSGDYGTSGNGGGIFGPGDGMGGVVIRGGGADGDHCEPHGGRGGMGGMGPVYMPYPTGGVGYPRGGSIGTGRSGRTGGGSIGRVGGVTRGRRG